MAKSKKPLARPNRHPCGTMDLHRRMAAESPEYRRRAREIEYETRRFVERHGPEGLRLGVVRIPVVVHILWNMPDQNFTDAQVQAQIDALNADFRATNADAVNVPSHFAPVAADTRIEFALAVRGPSCNFTTGIERRQVSKTGFTMANDDAWIKSTSAGGLSAWDTEHYLNIWTCYMTDGIIGYAGLPVYGAIHPSKDGVVLASYVFGTDPGHAPHHLGRIATHEVGHWLNLLHIWGDDQSNFPGGNCAGSDGCNDTPNQDVATVGPGTGIMISCGNGPHGNMYQNFMDYTDEVDKCMFTADQAARMNAALTGARREILNSTGLIPPDAPATPDFWIQRTIDDVGHEPYAGAGSICDSEDIWVRNGTDGHWVSDHQTPIGGQENMVYVRVRNRACPGTPAQLFFVRAYWAKASPSLSWPQPWDGSIANPAMGGPLGGSTQITAGGVICQFPWNVPDPSDYAAFGADRTHFCLLARIETLSTPPYGMTVPETGNLAANVVNNNNIAWKNVSVVDSDGPAMFADVVIGQFAAERRVARYAFELPAAPGPTIFDWGFLMIEARGEALAAWRRPGLGGKGFQRLEDGRLLIMKPGAWIEAPPMKRGAFGTLHIRFIPNGGRSLGARVLGLQLTERDRRGGFLGGQHFALRTATSPGPRWDNAPAQFDGVDWAMPPGPDCRHC